MKLIKNNSNNIKKQLLVVKIVALELCHVSFKGRDIFFQDTP